MAERPITQGILQELADRTFEPLRIFPDHVLQNAAE
jgi:hypothetical protein